MVLTQDIAHDRGEPTAAQSIARGLLDRGYIGRLGQVVGQRGVTDQASRQFLDPGSVDEQGFDGRGGRSAHGFVPWNARMARSYAKIPTLFCRFREGRGGIWPRRSCAIGL